MPVELRNVSSNFSVMQYVRTFINRDKLKERKKKRNTLKEKE